jgi:hypothetical protein
VRTSVIRPFFSVRANRSCAPGRGIATSAPASRRSSDATYCAPMHRSADDGMRTGRPRAAGAFDAASTERQIPSASSR